MIKPFSKLFLLTILLLTFPAISFAQVVINEIMYDPKDGDTSSGGEWIEIYNQGPNSIDLSTWFFFENNTHHSIQAQGNMSVPVGGYAVISRDITSFNNYFANFSGLLFKATFALTGAETISLREVKDGQDISETSYTSEQGAKNDGNSLQRQADSAWKAASPTPGVANNTASNTSDSDNQNTAGEVLGDSDSSSSSNVSSGGSNTTNVSSLNASLEILAGSDRVTTPGSPIWFQATVKKNTTGASPELNWSFGDGNVGVGSLVSHTYKYSGDYVVVLSAKAGDIFSVSRLKVKVAESNISVSDKGEYLEIFNNGNAEVNLFNWKLESEGKGFIFQPNTIILPKSSIKLDKNLLTMKGYDNSLGISLRNSLKEDVFAVAPIKYADLSEASKNLEIIKKEALTIQEKAKNLGFISQNNNLNVQSATVLSSEPKVLAEDGTVTTESTENIIYEAPKQVSFVTKLTNFIKRVFSK